MADQAGKESLQDTTTSIKRRGLLRFGTLVTAFTGASAISALGAKSAEAAPGDKNPPNTYVPIAEKGVASGVATLDVESKIPPAQLPDLSSTYGPTAEGFTTAFAPLLIGSQKAVRNRDLFVDAVAEGAPTDGTTDAQPRIGASHNLLPSKGGKVFLRKGSYLMGTRLIVTRPGMILEGEGVDATTLVLNAAMFQVGASDVLIRDMTIKGNGSNARTLFQLVNSGNFRNWRFENVKFDGVSTVPGRIGSKTADGSILSLTAGLDAFVEFEGCEWTAYTEDASFHARGTRHVTLDRCWFHDAGSDITKGDLIKFSAGAEYWKVLHCRLNNGSRDAIDAFDAQRGLIDGCTIVDMGVHGIELKVSSDGAMNPSDRIIVTNNHLVNMGTATPSPSMQLATSAVIATGNLIEGGSSYGMRSGKTNDGLVNTQNIIWANNYVRGAARHGFLLNGVDGAIVRDNAAIGCGGSGFYIPRSSVNSLVIGGPTENLSRGNTSADVWT